MKFDPNCIAITQLNVCTVCYTGRKLVTRRDCKYYSDYHMHFENRQSEYRIFPWKTIVIINPFLWVGISPTWCVCPVVCVSHWPSFQPGRWGWIWLWSVNQCSAAFRIKNNKLFINSVTDMNCRIRGFTFIFTKKGYVGMRPIQQENSSFLLHRKCGEKSGSCVIPR